VARTPRKGCRGRRIAALEIEMCWLPVSSNGPLECQRGQVSSARSFGRSRRNGGRSIICRISSATPPGDLGLPPSRLGGAAAGAVERFLRVWPEGAGEVAGAPALSFPKTQTLQSTRHPSPDILRPTFHASGVEERRAPSQRFAQKKRGHPPDGTPSLDRAGPVSRNLRGLLLLGLRGGGRG